MIYKESYLLFQFNYSSEYQFKYIFLFFQIKKSNKRKLKPNVCHIASCRILFTFQIATEIYLPLKFQTLSVCKKYTHIDDEMSNLKLFRKYTYI